MMLENKTAIITGAAEGIGRGIAYAFAEEGANVVIADIDIDIARKTALAIEKKYARSTYAVACDVSNEEQVKQMIRDTMERFFKLDILINNAGIFPFKPLLEMTVEEWDTVHAVNTRGVFLCTREAAKVMKENGKIINLSSVAANVGMPALTHYSSSKGGVSAFTRGAALELAEKKINVNAVAPGAINSSVEHKEQAGVSRDDTAISFSPPIPLKRMGIPKDIADTTIFLASDKADYITGQVIVVDGGWKIQ